MYWISEDLAEKVDLCVFLAFPKVSSNVNRLCSSVSCAMLKTDPRSLFADMNQWRHQ